MDDNGDKFLILQEITSHQKDDAVAMTSSVAWEISHHCNRHRKRTTAGWLLEVLWKGGTITWVPLKDLKESNPLQVAEYVVAQNLIDEPAFAWWAIPTIQSRDQMIGAIKARFHKKTHKYGI